MDRCVMTVEVHIENIFPTPIYISQVDISGVNVDDVVMRPNADMVTLSETDFLLDEPEYEFLKSQIDEHMRHYYHGVLQYASAVYPVMTSSWLVKSLPNQESSWHIHTNSIFSGVLYLTDEPNSGDITFKEELNMILPFTPPIDNENLYNRRFFSIKPQKGLLVMFPSTLTHKVGKNCSDEIRISIAFNYFLKGKFIDKTATLEIK
jgi:uncharacterized protein (TIGR02466 family)